MSSRVRNLLTLDELRRELARVMGRLESRHGRTALEALEDAEELTSEIKERMMNPTHLEVEEAHARQRDRLEESCSQWGHSYGTTDTRSNPHCVKCGTPYGPTDAERAVKYGVWCVDEGCFYDPTPRDWNDAVDATAMNCRTNTSHRFEVRELP